MFGRRKKSPNSTDSSEIVIENGTGNRCVLRTRWEAIPDQNWWRDFCRSAHHLSDGDLSTILQTLQTSLDGDSAQLITTPMSANSDVLGRLSRLGLAEIVEQSDIPTLRSEMMSVWRIVKGAERHAIKIILELRDVDAQTFDWEKRQRAELELAQIIPQLSGEGAQQIASIFSSFNNCVDVKQGLAVEEIFSTSERALFASDLGLNEDSSRELGHPVKKWQVTALGSVIVTLRLQDSHGRHLSS